MSHLEALGRWSAVLEHRPFALLVPGHQYVVIRGFTDYEGETHALGERWRFLTHSYLPHDAGLTLFVSPDEQHEGRIPLQDRAEQQAGIINRLAEYVVPVAAGSVGKNGPELGRGRLLLTALTMAVGAMPCLIATAARAPIAAIVGLALAITLALTMYLVIWPHWRIRALRRRILAPMRRHDVRVVLGPPMRQIELFSDSVLETWLYPPAAKLTERPIGISFAIDFDLDDRVIGVRRIRTLSHL